MDEAVNFVLRGLTMTGEKVVAACNSYFRNREVFWSIPHTQCSALKDVEILHVMERVGVACRKLEHPDSACVAEI